METFANPTSGKGRKNRKWRAEQAACFSRLFSGWERGWKENPVEPGNQREREDKEKEKSPLVRSCGAARNSLALVARLYPGTIARRVSLTV
jgi:hypothetical protein